MARPDGGWARRFRVDEPRRFRLKDRDPAATPGFKSREGASEVLERGIARLQDLQERLYAQDRWAVLVIFQAMDAAGKDSTIEHVMSGLNPQGCQVFSFKAPSQEELDHDFLWRTSRCLPERGRIGIFNRSYYEEVLVVRVHPELLSRERLPRKFVTKRLWKERFEDINAHERYLTRNGILVVKFFLHVSKEEQRRRFLRRIEDPSRNWKFSLGDVEERRHWSAYQRCYEEAIRATSTRHAPWYVVPADQKWFTRLAVAAALVDEIEGIHPAFPEVDAQKKKELLAARRALE